MKLSIILFLTFFISNSFAGQKRDSWIYGPSYSDITEELAQLSITYPNHTEFIHYGKGEAGNNLYAILIKNPNTIITKLSLITGAHHGNEYLNIADRLPRLLLNDISNDSSGFSTYLKTGGSLLVIPIVNPWGYIERKRANSLGQDLNRDYSLIGKPSTGFKHLEVSELNKLVTQKLMTYNAKLDFTLDYHCCNGARGKGALIWTNNFDRIKVRKKKYFVIKDIFKSNLRGLTAGTAMDIVGYDPKGTSNDYWDNYLNAYSLVFEGQQGKENKKLKKHFLSLSKIFTLF